VTISYRILPASSGTHDILTVWTYQGGYDETTTTINALPKTAPTSIVQPITEEFPAIKPVIGEIQINLTPIVIIIIIFGFMTAAYIVLIKAAEHMPPKVVYEASVPDEDVAIEDLRAFIKLGLRRGYTLRQMSEELHASRLNTEHFKEIAKEEMVKDMDRMAKLREQEMSSDDKFVKRLKGIIRDIQEK
jgi:hypothetical protein